MFIDIARSRHSCRSYSDEPLTEDEINLIMEAGDLAPSSRDLRPVQLIPVRDIPTIRSLASCKDHGAEPLGGATFAVVVTADEDKADTWLEDASIASIMMQLEAEDLGIGSCWIQVRLRSLGGRPAEDVVRELMGLEDGTRVLSVISFGRKA